MLYYSHSGRRLIKWHHFLEVYDQHLSALRQKAKQSEGDPTAAFAPGGKLRILEIGVLMGGSLQLWKRYFEGRAVFSGSTINPQCAEYEEEGISIRIGDQSSPEFLKSVIDEMGGVDIVIDDGSHIASHQVASFVNLFPALSMGGKYFCEDLLHPTGMVGRADTSAPEPSSRP